MTGPSQNDIAAIVRNTRVAAVVGMKDESRGDAPAFTVPRRMKERGIRVIPVNPTVSSSLGERAFPRLADVDVPFDLVQVFRRIDAIPEVVDDILSLPEGRRPRVVWLQSGIIHEAAAARLRAAGMTVVMDRCFAVELAVLG